MSRNEKRKRSVPAPRYYSRYLYVWHTLDCNHPQGYWQMANTTMIIMWLNSGCNGVCHRYDKTKIIILSLLCPIAEHRPPPHYQSVPVLGSIWPAL